MIGANIVTAVQESLLVSPHLVDCLSKMGEGLSLSQRRIVVQFGEIPDELVIELSYLNRDSPLSARRTFLRVSWGKSFHHCGKDVMGIAAMLSHSIG